MLVNTAAAQRPATDRQVYNGHIEHKQDGTVRALIITEGSPVSLIMSRAEAASMADGLDMAGPAVSLFEVSPPVVATSPAVGADDDEAAEPPAEVKKASGGARGRSR